MSRLGKKPVAIPNGVSVSFTDGVLSVKGPKGTLTRSVRDEVSIVIENDTVQLAPAKQSPLSPALWGTYAAHLNNMIEGVTAGFTKILDIEGVGYRAELKGKNLVLSMGFSHPVSIEVPEGVTATVEKSSVTLTSPDKELLGQFAANVRKVRKPEPYKGKGIRYRGEFIIRKQGKKAA